MSQLIQEKTGNSEDKCHDNFYLFSAFHGLEIMLLNRKFFGQVNLGLVSLFLGQVEIVVLVKFNEIWVEVTSDLSFENFKIFLELLMLVSKFLLGEDLLVLTSSISELYNIG